VWQYSRLGSVCVGLLSLSAIELSAQSAADYQENRDWARLPEGRSWGAVSGVFPDPDGEHIWVIDRCGADSCLDSELHPIFKFDLAGRLVANFGAGIIPWPHGLFVDAGGNVWVADGATGARVEEAARRGLGHQVFKFSPEGALLMTLGTAGRSGRGPNLFEGPSELFVAPTGEIFIADGHGADGNNRIVKLAPDGRFLMEWGRSGSGPAPGEFSDPHDLAVDSSGRLFIGDRRNHRIQIYDQEGRFLDQWTHFGSASGIFIDANDAIYVMDTQTGIRPSWITDHPDPERGSGVWIGDARTGRIRDFLPAEAEFVAVDRSGNIYGAEIQRRSLVRYERIR